MSCSPKGQARHNRNCDNCNSVFYSPPSFPFSSCLDCLAIVGPTTVAAFPSFMCQWCLSIKIDITADSIDMDDSVDWTLLDAGPKAVSK